MRLSPIALSVLFVVAAVGVGPGFIAVAADAETAVHWETLLMSPDTVALPAPLVELLGPGRDQAPPVQTLTRQLGLAQSRYRAYMEEERGLSLAIQVPAEANEVAFGAGAALAATHVAGDTTAQASIGVGTVYRWDSQQMVAAPQLTFSVKHQLGTTPKDVEDALQHVRLHEAEVIEAGGVRTWMRDVIQAYAAVVAADSRLHIGSRRYVLAQRELAAALDKTRVGAISEAELHNARQNVLLRETDLDAWELDADGAAFRWAQLAGQAPHPVAAEFDGIHGSFGDAVAAGDEAGLHYVVLRAAEGLGVGDGDEEQAWVDYALAQHPRLALADEQVQLARTRVADAQREAGMAGHVEAGIAYPSKTNEVPPTLGWRVAAGLNWPLHNEQATEQLLQAELQLEQAEADRHALTEQLEADVRLAFRRQQGAVRHLVRMMDDRRYAEELLGLAQAAEQAGLGTAVDVLAAEIQLLESQRAATDAYYDAMVQRLALWHAVGVDARW